MPVHFHSVVEALQSIPSTKTRHWSLKHPQRQICLTWRAPLNMRSVSRSTVSGSNEDPATGRAHFPAQNNSNAIRQARACERRKVLHNHSHFAVCKCQGCSKDPTDHSQLHSFFRKSRSLLLCSVGRGETLQVSWRSVLAQPC